jgi:hypothetical protein
MDALHQVWRDAYDRRFFVLARSSKYPSSDHFMYTAGGFFSGARGSFFPGGNFNVVGSPLTIAHGYAFELDKTAVVVGPAGLAYDGDSDTLYVASELDNEIFALRGAGKTTSDLGTVT